MTNCVVCGQPTYSDYLDGRYHEDCAAHLLDWVAELSDKPAWEDALSIIFRAIGHEQRRVSRDQLRLLEV